MQAWQDKTSHVDYPIEEWERVLRINLTASIPLLPAVAPHMVKAGYGRIVNIASVAGKEGNPMPCVFRVPRPGHLAHQVPRQGAGAIGACW